MSEGADSLLSRLDDMDRVVWGDDAPELWSRLSHQPAVRTGNTVRITSSAAVAEAMRQPGEKIDQDAIKKFLDDERSLRVVF